MADKSTELRYLAKALRVRKGYSQAEAAAAYGYTQPHISALESGALGIEEVKKYVQFLSVLPASGLRTPGSARVGRQRRGGLTSAEFAVLQNRKDVFAARKALRETIASNSARPQRFILGHQGNTWSSSMYYITSVDLWTVFDDGIDELWNTYGIGNPLDGGDRDMICHLSVPVEGINRRIGAVYASSNKDGGVYVLHRGKIGGGREGIGKSAFFEHYRGRIATAHDGDRETKFAVVGKIGSATFLRDLRKFVVAVKDIKEKVTS